ncbi:MAG TPA: hypothetical protein VFU27_05310 [Terriglobales bacterium]|nr:hypothetical protein [Terriglobales bacterium]
MLITAVLIFLVLAAIVLLVRAARGQSAAGVAALNDLQGRTVAIDIAAFRNLISAGEEAYLRRNLPALQFRRIQRKRMRAAAAYIRGALHNAAILLRLGEAAQRSPDPNLAIAGRKLVDTAVRLRLYAFFALLQLYLNIAFPSLRLSPAAIADRYEVLTEAMARFTRLQQPGLVTRISLTL